MICLVSTIDDPYHIQVTSHVEDYAAFMKYPDPDLTAVKQFLDINGLINDVLTLQSNGDLSLTEDTFVKIIANNLDTSQLEDFNIGVSEENKEQIIRDLLEQYGSGLFTDQNGQQCLNDPFSTIDPSDILGARRLNYTKGETFNQNQNQNQKQLKQPISRDSNHEIPQHVKSRLKFSDIDYAAIDYDIPLDRPPAPDLSFSTVFEDIVKGDTEKYYNSEAFYKQWLEKRNRKVESLNKVHFNRFMDHTLEQAEKQRRLEDAPAEPACDNVGIPQPDAVFDNNTFNMDRMTINQFLADPYRFLFIIRSTAQFVVLRFIYDQFYAIGLKETQIPILSMFGNHYFLPQCVISQTSPELTEYYNDLSGSNSSSYPAVGIYKKMVVYSEVGIDYALQYRQYLSNYIIVNEEDIEIISNKREYEQLYVDTDSKDICFAVELEALETQNASDVHISYNIRMGTDDTPSTFRNLNPFIYMNTNYIEYIQTGFYNLQALTDKFFMQVLAEEIYVEADLGNVDVMLYAHNHKTSEYSISVFFIIASLLFPFIFVATYLVPVISLTSKVMTEKENNVKSGMKLMGCRNQLYWVSWWLYYLIYQMVVSFITTTFMVWYLYTQISFLALYVSLVLFGFGSITFITMVTTFFKRNYIAILVAIFAYFTSFNMNLAYDNGNQNFNPTSVFFGCLFPTLSINFSLSLLTSVQNGGFNFDLSNLFAEVNNYSLGLVWTGQLLGIALWMTLTLYLDKVIPTTNEVSKPWNYPYFELLKFFYGSDADTKHNINQVLDVEKVMAEDSTLKNREELNAEYAAKLDRKELMRIRHLFKKYDGAVVNALDDVTVDLFQDDITVLLGPNGAGKSTLISTLIGKSRIDQGSIHFKDHPDYYRFLEKNREKIGICPQYNIIFPNLTAYEHLYLFSIFKGIPNSEIQAAITKVKNELNMGAFMNKLVSNLSGGQKRRTSIAIALLGECEMVVFDEPTAGLDPTSRRHLWDLLKKSKFGKVMLMSTHYMDEAEYLGDRIALIHEGDIKCVGSLTYLRETFAKGTSLEIAFDDKSKIDLFNHYLDEIKIEYEFNQIKTDKACYLIADFEDIYKVVCILEDKQQIVRFQISNFNLSQSKLDDIFFRVIGSGGGYDNVVNDDSTGNTNQQDSNDREYLVSEKKTKDFGKTMTMSILTEQEKFKTSSLFKSHFVANFLKRYRYNKRDLFGICCEIVFPLVIIIVGLVLSKIGQSRIASFPTMYFNYNEINDYKGSYNRKILDFPQNLYYSVYEEDNPNLDLALANKFFSKLNTLRSDINTVRTNYSYDSRYEQIFGRYFEDMIYFDEYIFENYYQTDKFGLSTDVPKPIGHINLFTNQVVPELAPQFIFKNIWFMQVDFESAYYHHMVILQNWIHTAIIRAVADTDAVNIYARNKPLPRSRAEQLNLDAFFNTAFASLLVLSVSLVGVGIVYFILCEKESEMKNIIFLSGMQSHAYWMSNFAYDFLKYMTFAVLAVLIVWLFGVSSLLATENSVFQVFCMVLLVQGLAVIACSYFVSMLFSTTGNGMLFILIFYSTLSLISFLIYNVMNSDYIRGISSDAIDYFWFVFLVNPNFTLYTVMNELFAVGQVDLNNSFQVNDSALSHKVTQWVWYNLYVTLIYFFMTLFMEWSNLVRLFTQKVQVDASMVVNETDCVFKSSKVSLQPKVIETQDIIKYYGSDFLLSRYIEYTDNKLALKGVSFDVKEGDCFVMLGSNGAGKSTLFKIMLSEILPTSGQVTVKGMELNAQNVSEIRKYVGYCPQMNSCYEYLTVREHLDLILAIKNIRDEHSDKVIDEKLAELRMKRFEHYTASTLSGGNQRKLNYAIATLTDPELLFLDEPTSSMDPIARKSINENIVKNKKSENTVFYCTHIIDEAEYVSDQIAIMINGKIRAIGSGLELKNHFGKYYVVWIVLKGIDKQLKTLMTHKNDKLYDRLIQDTEEQFDLNAISNKQIKNMYIDSVKNTGENGLKILQYTATSAHLILKRAKKLLKRESMLKERNVTVPKSNLKQPKYPETPSVWGEYKCLLELTTNEYGVSESNQHLDTDTTEQPPVNVEIGELMFNLVKVKIDKNSAVQFSQIFKVFNSIKNEFDCVKTFSIDSMNLEEIFWNLNQDYLNEDI